jgi:CBS domain-containing protein
MNLREAQLQEPSTITLDTPVVEVAQILRDKKLRHLYVLDAKEFPVGIISITDINSKIVAEGKSPEGLTAEDIMTAPLHMIEIDNDLSKAYYEMIRHNTVAIPIVDNGLLVGVLSMNDALKLMVKRKHES